VSFKSNVLKRKAEGQSCIACGAEDGTVVLAHRNEHKARASGIDVWALELCYRCHVSYDQGNMSRDEKRRFFNDLFPDQVLRWINRGLLVIGD
jgi:hypothetical protein